MRGCFESCRGRREHPLLPMRIPGHGVLQGFAVPSGHTPDPDPLPKPGLGALPSTIRSFQAHHRPLVLLRHLPACWVWGAQPSSPGRRSLWHSFARIFPSSVM